ncbi:MAG TPA: SCO family protein [Candidatus Binatia bacterium]|nr:SCO family protein [Candidatus Binatia bacterium]
MRPNRNSLAIVVFVGALLAFGAACNRSSQSSANKRYSLKGKVVSIDKNAGTANIDNEPISGFMDAMVMPYAIQPPAMLAQLQPGDSITADVVVSPDKYWLENVQITGHSQPAAKPASSLHIPEPGDEVPDFELVNQNGRRIRLSQYRGETVLLTLIYTRCPFPDYCPRVSHEFAAIDRQLRADSARYGKTHLLSVSFDPAHDTPKVLRDYGFSCAASKDASVFKHWEFAAVPQAELPAFANYFALTYKEEGGLITHSLSTAVISADGKIFKWYHGADWQAADLLQDAAAAQHSAVSLPHAANKPKRALGLNAEC